MAFTSLKSDTHAAHTALNILHVSLKKGIHMKPTVKGIPEVLYFALLPGVVVYDVTNMESFLNLPTWLEEVERHTGPDVTKVDFALET